MTAAETDKWTRSDGDSWDIVSSVGFTALGVAAARAVETKRPDALIHDEFAERFVLAAGEPHLIEFVAKPDLADKAAFGPPRHMGLRSKFFDEYFLAATEAGVKQAVILAAGLDVRAHRLPWPAGTVVFEVDQPKVLEFKDRILDGAAPTSDRREVVADLRDDWPATLKAAGFDPTVPTAWSAEGLLPYLPGAAQDLLFERIVELSAPGSQVGVESFRGVFDVSRFKDIQDKLDPDGDSPFAKVDISGLFYTDERADPEQWFAEHGWTVTPSTTLELSAQYGVPVLELSDELKELANKMVYFSAVLPG